MAKARRVILSADDAKTLSKVFEEVASLEGVKVVGKTPYMALIECTKETQQEIQKKFPQLIIADEKNTASIDLPVQTVHRKPKFK